MGKNPITHWEIMGSDGHAVAAFYSKVFDWTPQAWDDSGEYFGIDDGQGGVGGAVGKGSAERPNYVAVYIGVDSIDEHLKLITAAGGTTVAPRTVIPGVVAWGMFKDPFGNFVGLTEHTTPAAK
jgi:predicted enzyme related to lactoylglutathione lyase